MSSASAPVRTDIVVHKYGGSSVGTPEKVQNIAKRVVEAQKQGKKVVVVVSAMGKTTDQLVALATKVCPNPQGRELDMLLSSGEQVTIALLAMAIQQLGHKAISFTAPQINFRTDSVHNKARIREIGTERIHKHLDRDEVVIVAGFQGINDDDDITTLGRGGSDLTAVALAVVLGAKICEIYTDVDGVYTTDPRIEPKAKRIEQIAYEEMLELASMGAKVMHSRSVEFAQKYDMPIAVRSSFTDGPGTLITKEVEAMEDVVITGIALNTNEAKVTIQSVPDTPGMAAQIFNKLAVEGINIDVIIQNVSSDGTTDISFTAVQEDLARAMEVSQQIGQEIQAGSVSCQEEVAKVSVVGVGMRRHAGVAAKMFECFAKEKVNIEMISTSEIKISCVIGAEHGETMVKALHEKFQLA